MLMTTVAVIFVSSDKIRFAIWLISIAVANPECRGTVPPGDAVTAMRRPMVVQTDTVRIGMCQ